MSQIDNKVKWCIRKAEKEIKEGLMHRGLIKIEPDIEEAKKHIKKAEHNLKALRAFSEIGFSDWSISAVFYSIYHCFLAIAVKFGYESRNQECTLDLIEQLKQQENIDISNELIESLRHIEPERQHENNVITLRESFQYGTETIIDETLLAAFEKLCQQAIDETKKIIYEKK